VKMKISEQTAESILCLPIYSDLSKESQFKIIEVITKNI
jgi:hypothetical protein